LKNSEMLFFQKTYNSLSCYIY